MLKTKKYCIVGMGNIGKIITERLLSIGVPPEQIRINDSDLERIYTASEKYHVKGIQLDDQSVNDADMIILATPPPKTILVLRTLKNNLRKGQVIVSMAAAIPLESLRLAIARDDVSIVRVLPNPPSILGQGMNPVVFPEGIPGERKSFVEAFLGVLGKTVVVKDDQMTWCVGLTGAAMRSVLPVLDGMSQAGIEAGLTASDARKVAAQIMMGTASLALETDLSFEEIKALTPMETLDEKMVAGLFLETARKTKEKVDKSQAQLMGV